MDLPTDYNTLAGIGAAASAIVSIIATKAAYSAATAARQSTELAVRQQRDTLVREVYRDASRSTVMATRVDQLAETVKTATTNMLVAAGQGTGSAMDKLSADHQDLHARAKEITDYALRLLDSDPTDHADNELGAIQRRLDAHLAQLEGMKDHLATDLELVRTGASDPRAAVLRAAQLREMHHRPGGF